MLGIRRAPAVADDKQLAALAHRDRDGVHDRHHGRAEFAIRGCALQRLAGRAEVLGNVISAILHRHYLRHPQARVVAATLHERKDGGDERPDAFQRLNVRSAEGHFRSPNSAETARGSSFYWRFQPLGDGIQGARLR